MSLPAKADDPVFRGVSDKSRIRSVLDAPLSRVWRLTADLRNAPRQRPV
jgi:hypothetical protein